VRCAKTVERIDLPLGLWTVVGRRKHKFIIIIIFILTHKNIHIKVTIHRHVNICVNWIIRPKVTLTINQKKLSLIT